MLFMDATVKKPILAFIAVFKTKLYQPLFPACVYIVSTMLLLEEAPSLTLKCF